MTQNIFTNSSRAGLYCLSGLRQHRLREMTSQAHLRLLKAEFGAARELGEILTEFGKALHFPTWYGANLDALHDCLTDPDWQQSRGVAIQINGLDGLRQSAPQDFSTLIEVLGSATQECSATPSPLWILLDTPAHGVAALPEA